MSAGEFSPELELSKGSGQAGTSFTIAGEFCDEGDLDTFVEITLVETDGDEHFVEVPVDPVDDEDPEDEAGDWSTEFSIPEDTTPGDLTIDATCFAEDDGGSVIDLHNTVGFRSAGVPGQFGGEQFSYETASFIVLPPSPEEPPPGEPGEPGEPGQPGEPGAPGETPETPEVPAAPETPETPSATPVEGSPTTLTG